MAQDVGIDFYHSPLTERPGLPHAAASEARAKRQRHSEATLRPGKQDDRRGRSGRHDAALIITLLDGSRSPRSMRKGDIP